MHTNQRVERCRRRQIPFADMDDLRASGYRPRWYDPVWF